MKILGFIAATFITAVALAQAPISQGVVCSSYTGNQAIGAAFGPSIASGTCHYWDLANNSRRGVLITVDFSSQVICATASGNFVYNGRSCPQTASAIKTLAQCKSAHLCF